MATYQEIVNYIDQHYTKNEQQHIDGPIGNTALKMILDYAKNNSADNATIKKTIESASHGFSPKEVLYYNGTNYIKAISSAQDTLGFLFVSEADANTFTIVQAGYVSGLTGLTPGSYYYVSQSVAGEITNIKPSSGYANPIFVALTENSGFVLPYNGDVSWNNIANKPDVGAGSDTTAIHEDESGEIAAIDPKTTPADADVTMIEDSADGNQKKRLSWANIKATLKIYFDTLYIAITTLTTKGDILVRNGTGVTRLPVGTDDQVLTADSTVGTGVAWKAGGGGSSGHTIQNNGSNMPAEDNLNVVGMTIEDDAGNSATKITHKLGDETNVDDTGKKEGSIFSYDEMNDNHVPQDQEEFDFILYPNDSNLDSSSDQMACFIPDGYRIISIDIKEDSGNAATDIDVGTSSVGTQIVNSETVNANQKKTLSFTAFVADGDQDLYISITGSAVISIIFTCVKTF